MIHALGSLQYLCLMFMRLAGSPLWSKERNEAIVVQMGVSLVLQCRPPAGLPPPVIFWMDNSELFACLHISTIQWYKDINKMTFNRTMADKQRRSELMENRPHGLLEIIY